MSVEVYTTTVATPVAEPVHRQSDHRLLHIPVVDEKRKLVGMMAPSDLINLLYRHVALAAT